MYKIRLLSGFSGRGEVNINLLVGPQKQVSPVHHKEEEEMSSLDHSKICFYWKNIIQQQYKCVMIILLHKLYFVYIFIQEWIISVEAERNGTSVLSHKNTFPLSIPKWNKCHLIKLHLQQLRWWHNAKT